MASQVEIINVALTRLGAQTISSLEDGIPEANAANALWSTARQSSLRDHPWNFATAEATLSAVVGGETYRYKYAYQIPSDSLRVLEVFDNDDFKQAGKLILTDAGTCVIKYIKDVEDTYAWDALFTDVMAQRLSAEMAYTLTKNQSTADTQFTLYGQKLQKARFVDATEETQDPFGDVGFILKARF